MIKLNTIWNILKSNFFNTGYTDNCLWVFGEWFGNRCCDNSLYYANYIAENYPDINCAWIAKKGTDLSLLDDRIPVYEFGLPDTIKLVENAQVLFMNQGFKDFSDSLIIPKGPLSVNLWHGVPWKKIGIDGYREMNLIKKGYYFAINKLLSADFFLSVSDVMTHILCSSCGADKERIICAGYPRNNLFYNSKQIENCRKKLLLYIAEKYPEIEEVEQLKIITYMPTFRDKKQEQFNFLDIKDAYFQEILHERNAIIVQKAHFAGEKISFSHNCASRVIVEDEYPSQELLASTDILITDYSSCFFDFLLLNRPIIHFLYDYDYYSKNDRGLYYPKEDIVCGDVVEDEKDLIESIVANLDDPMKNSVLREKRRQEYVTYESPESCEIITDYVFEQIRSRKKG